LTISTAGGTTNDSDLPEHAGAVSAELLPARMLNEYAYCPRLFHLMHVEGRWADNVYTEHGREVHRRVDAVDDPCRLPPVGTSRPPWGAA